MGAKKKHRLKRNREKCNKRKKTKAPLSKTKHSNSCVTKKREKYASEKRTTEVYPTTSKRIKSDIPSTSRAEEIDIPVNKDSTEYNMNHLCRGNAIIFHHKTYKKCLSDMAAEEGSRIEVEKLWKTLSKLDFNVTVYDDLTLPKFKQVIHNLAKNSDHTDDDCIAIIVLTHCVKNNMLYTKDHTYDVQELWMPFRANECPTLAGKPKLFFIEVCKDDEPESGKNEEATIPQVDSESDAYTIPDCADFLIAYSTVEDCFTTQDDMEGSWFIGNLCDELEKLTPYTDLLKIMTRITKHVTLNEDNNYSEFYTSEDKKRQVLHLHSTLTRDVFFYPKF